MNHIHLLFNRKPLEIHSELVWTLAQPVGHLWYKSEGCGLESQRGWKINFSEYICNDLSPGITSFLSTTTYYYFYFIYFKCASTWSTYSHKNHCHVVKRLIHRSWDQKVFLGKQLMRLILCIMNIAALEIDSSCWTKHFVPSHVSVFLQTLSKWLAYHLPRTPFGLGFDDSTFSTRQHFFN